MTESNPLNEMLTAASDAMRADWLRLVEVGSKIAKDGETISEIAHALAKAGGSSEDSIKRKLCAIQFMQTLGYSEAEIVTFGQTTALSEYGKSKKAESYEKMTSLVFKVPGSQREVVQMEFERVKKVLGITTSEQLFDFIVAQFRQTSDEELRHAAGDLYRGKSDQTIEGR